MSVNQPPDLVDDKQELEPKSAEPESTEIDSAESESTETELAQSESAETIDWDTLSEGMQMILFHI